MEIKTSEISGQICLVSFLITEEEQRDNIRQELTVPWDFHITMKQKQEEDYPLMDQPELPEHPPTSSVDIVEGSDDAYQDPPDLTLPLTIERSDLEKSESDDEESFELHPLLRTTYTTTYPGYDMMSAYYHASQIYQSGPPPPPPDIQPIVDKTADYVAKNGDSFQNTIVKHHLDDRRFDFLHPWNQYNAYYKAKVLDCREKRKR
ncbi:uncharacterized protein LOC121392681 [Gigantopelta aegis]|uniref:uncharacterized protein LOC121392681 n=1 Tax=Gigantopelta aegis TaxID=1735272 RepID=UPI001B889A52|nr:uncharacterized protein LOC121392681 [Gigantopelta aegis]